MGNQPLVFPVIVAQVPQIQCEQMGIRKVLEIARQTDVDRAPPAANVGDYARVIFDLSLRRELIRIGGDIATAAQGGAEEKRTARDQNADATSSPSRLAAKKPRATSITDWTVNTRAFLGASAPAWPRPSAVASCRQGLRLHDPRSTSRDIRSASRGRRRASAARTVRAALQPYPLSAARARSRRA